jgi:flagellar FliJ protein
MAKHLKALIRLNKWHVDERRRELGILLAKELEIEEWLVRLDEELHEEQKVAAASEVASFTYGGYARHYILRREEGRANLAAVQREILAARDRLADAYRELKTFEITQATRERREREEASQREQKILDEVGLNLHRRRLASEAGQESR